MLTVGPMRPLPEGWMPDPSVRSALSEEFGGVVDLNLSLRRFRNHYSEGQTSRNWNARFENWVLADAERMRDREGGTDEFGNPRNQRKTSVYPDALQPGDPGYVDWSAQ